MTRRLAPALAVALSLAPGVAFSQPQPPTPPTPATPATPPGAGTSRVAEARRYAAEAVALLQRHDYRGAIRAFELAYGAAPSPELWYNIARSHEMLREYEQAIDYYRRYLRDKVDPPDRAEVEAHIRDLEERAERARRARLRQAAGTTIRVEVPVRGARIFLDERPVAVAPAAGTFAVSPGPHAVRVEADGMQPWRAEVRARPDDETVVFAGLQRATRFRTIARPHIASAILGGLGIAALGGGAYFGATALGADCVDCDARRDRATTADVLLGAGVGLAVAAVVVYFVERGASRTERVP